MPLSHLPLLKSVSRSFYITVRVLPRAMREPVALAYLLARATDTIADAPGIEPWSRLEMLTWLREAINYPHKRDWDTEIVAPIIEIQRTAHPGEALLLEALPELLDWLHALSEADAFDVRWVLGVITSGQALDIQRFEIDQIGALTSAEDLDDYTYRVAGCVGEFWTRLARRKLRKYSDLPTDLLLEKGVKFGKGLQLVNILRDVKKDAANGRRYLVEQDIPAALARAEDYLLAAAAYTHSLNAWRLRFACALPVALGFETLQLLRDGHKSAKVPRKRVYQLMRRLAWVSRSKGALRKAMP